ncbi:MAG TPA: glycosyltransferase family 39 protein [Candidatus Hydrogenedentes bacterium]|nr:glycosyltransferase family 39 protein [Candidatus Hydrogenedentota bacterium]
MAHTFCATLRHHKHIPVLMFLFLTGLLLRASWLMEIQRTPDFQIPLLYQVDMGFIDNSALDYAQALRAFFHLPDIELKFERQIVWRHHAGDPLLRPPGYTFFLSLLYFLFGDNQLLVRIVQMSLGMAGGLLGFLAGRKLAGVRAGVIAAGALWLYWPLILYESVLHEPVLVVFVSLLFLNSALQWLKTTGLKQAAKTGFLCGIFTVCASQIILFLPVMLLWFLWFGCKRFRNLRRSLSHAGLAGLFFFLPLLPVSCLNYYESGMFVLNSHGHGITLYIGNQPGAEGLLMPGKPLAEEFLGLQDSGLRADEIETLFRTGLPGLIFLKRRQSGRY